MMPLIISIIITIIITTNLELDFAVSTCVEHHSMHNVLTEFPEPFNFSERFQNNTWKKKKFQWYKWLVQWKKSLRFTSRKPERKGKSTWYVWRVSEPGGAGGWHSMLDILRRYCSNASWRTHHKVGRRNTQRRRGERKRGGRWKWQ